MQEERRPTVSAVPRRLNGGSCGAVVLLVEDDDTIGTVVVETLRDEGYLVEWARSPHEAIAVLAAAEPDTFDLVLSDAFAHPRAPYAWLERLRAATAAPIVICSGHPVILFADYALRGFAAYLPKPFDLDEVVYMVASRGGPLQT